MIEGILVFAGKQVGTESLEYLFEIGAPVHRVIAASTADKQILDSARAKHVHAEVYRQATQDRLVSGSMRYKWLLNLWSSHILPTPVLALAKHRLNIHPSLVPHCRGNDNAAWAIRKGLPAGVSLIEMRESVDVGEVYVQRELPYTLPIRGWELHQRLQKESVAVFKQFWPDIYAGKMVPQPQGGPVTSHRRKDTEADRVLDAATFLTLEDFVRWALAHDFSPNTTAEVWYRGSSYKLTVNLEEKIEGR